MDYFTRLLNQHRYRADAAADNLKADLESAYCCVMCDEELGSKTALCCLADVGKDENEKWVCVECQEAHAVEIKAKECCLDEHPLRYACPDCTEKHSDEDGARECCPTLVCPVCLREAGSVQDQVDCCLLLDPTMTVVSRHVMTQLLQRGADWEDARAQAQAMRIPA